MKRKFPIIIPITVFFLTLLITNHVYSQTTLQKHFTAIANTISGNIGISALHIETGESISYNGDKKFPMQSVYKFPIAMVIPIVIGMKLTTANSSLATPLQ